MLNLIDEAIALEAQHTFEMKRPPDYQSGRILRGFSDSYCDMFWFKEKISVRYNFTYQSFRLHNLHISKRDIVYQKIVKSGWVCDTEVQRAYKEYIANVAILNL